jgi:hypothetical protein
MIKISLNLSIILCLSTVNSKKDGINSLLSFIQHTNFQKKTGGVFTAGL